MSLVQFRVVVVIQIIMGFTESYIPTNALLYTIKY